MWQNVSYEMKLKIKMQIFHNIFINEYFWVILIVLLRTCDNTLPLVKQSFVSYNFKENETIAKNLIVLWIPRSDNQICELCYIAKTVPPPPPLPKHPLWHLTALGDKYPPPWCLHMGGASAKDGGGEWEREMSIRAGVGNVWSDVRWGGG